jgi:hypothetical protein
VREALKIVGMAKTELWWCWLDVDGLPSLGILKLTGSGCRRYFSK